MQAWNDGDVVHFERVQEITCLSASHATLRNSLSKSFCVFETKKINQDDLFCMWKHPSIFQNSFIDHNTKKKISFWATTLGRLNCLRTGLKELTHKSLFVSETFLTYKTLKLHHQCNDEVPCNTLKSFRVFFLCTKDSPLSQEPSRYSIDFFTFYESTSWMFISVLFNVKTVTWCEKTHRKKTVFHFEGDESEWRRCPHVWLCGDDGREAKVDLLM